MTNFTRREFLRRLASGAGALAGGWLISACGARKVPPLTPTTSGATRPISAATPFAPTDIPPSPTAALAATSPSTLPAAIAGPDLVVARGGEPEELVRRALAALGGMEQFVSVGDDVIVKPNICVAYHSYEYAATTNPWVVGALVKLCLEAGARRVRVMDYPFGGTPEEAYVRSGIQEQVLAAGGEMEIISHFKFQKTELPAGLDLHQCEIYSDALEADVIIDVPIAKHHNLARLTLGMKNLMGVVKNRPALHRNLGQRLADLSNHIRPTLTVVDAVRILMNHGPTGGDLDDVKKLDTIIASPDIVAADSYAATLFGLQPEDLSYVKAGAEMGLGRSDLKSLKIEEVTVGG